MNFCLSTCLLAFIVTTAFAQSASNGNLSDAIVLGEPRLVRAVMVAGASATAKDEEGWTPVHYAAAEASVAVLGAMADAGARIPERTRDVPSPLTLAVMRNDVPTLAFLVSSFSGGQAGDWRFDEVSEALEVAVAQGRLTHVGPLIVHNTLSSDEHMQLAGIFHRHYQYTISLEQYAVSPSFIVDIARANRTLGVPNEFLISWSNYASVQQSTLEPNARGSTPDVARYCSQRYRAQSRLLQRERPYSWACAPTDGYLVSVEMRSVCRSQFGDRFKAVLRNSNDGNSWVCIQ